MQKLFHAMVVLTTAMVIACAALLGWALFLERPFLTYENLPFPPQIQKVRPGEVMPVRVRRCNAADGIRYYGVTHEIRRVDDDKTYLLKFETVSIKPGCTESVSLVNQLPMNIEPGIYVVTGTAIVDGTIRQHLVPWISQPFEVGPQ